MVEDMEDDLNESLDKLYKRYIWVVVKIMAPVVWGTLNNRCRIIIGTQKGTLILTTNHMGQWHVSSMRA